MARLCSEGHKKSLSGRSFLRKWGYFINPFLHRLLHLWLFFLYLGLFFSSICLFLFFIITGKQDQQRSSHKKIYKTCFHVLIFIVFGLPIVLSLPKDRDNLANNHSPCVRRKTSGPVSRQKILAIH